MGKVKVSWTDAIVSWTDAMTLAVIGVLTSSKKELYNIINSPQLQRVFSFNRVDTANFPENYTTARVSLLAYDEIKDSTIKIPVIEIIVNITITSPLEIKKAKGETQALSDENYVIKNITMRSIVESMDFEKTYDKDDMSLVNDALDLMHSRFPIDLQKTPEIFCL